jgi:hypothetical protein
MTVFKIFGRFVLYLSISKRPVKSPLEFITVLPINSRNFIKGEFTFYALDVHRG